MTVRLLGWIGLAVPLFLAGSPSLAGPASSDDGPQSDQAPGDEGPSDASPRDVSGLRERLEQDMRNLGQLASQARSDNDAARAGCVLDKQERGRSVMEVATGELLVLKDSNSSAQQKTFAIEKLRAAADRLDGLVEQARRCSGDEGPKGEDDETQNDLDEPKTIPEEDPTRGAGRSPVPPSVDDHRPLTVASPSR